MEKLIIGKAPGLTSGLDRRSFLLLTGAALTTPAHEWLIARPLDDVSRSAGRKSSLDSWTASTT